ncbi:unnamed protein product [Amoebophrya sp. A25]|nr:unnamed protein product [Amoebophrya sp. A25]|eukprot:GSA25T00019991001.1
MKPLSSIRMVSTSPVVLPCVWILHDYVVVPLFLVVVLSINNALFSAVAVSSASPSPSRETSRTPATIVGVGATRGSCRVREAAHGFPVRGKELLVGDKDPATAMCLELDPEPRLDSSRITSTSSNFTTSSDSDSGKTKTHEMYAGGMDEQRNREKGVEERSTKGHRKKIVDVDEINSYCSQRRDDKNGHERLFGELQDWYRDLNKAFNVSAVYAAYRTSWTTSSSPSPSTKEEEEVVRGLFAARDLKRGEIVARIPSRAVFYCPSRSVPSCVPDFARLVWKSKNQVEVGDVDDELEEVPDENKKKEKPDGLPPGPLYLPYFRHVLPRSSQAYGGLWLLPESILKGLRQFSVVFAQALSRKEQMAKQEYAITIPQSTGDQKPQIGVSELNRSFLEYAHILLDQRAIPVSERFAQKRLHPSTVAIIPWIDLVNHDAKYVNVEWVSERKSKKSKTTSKQMKQKETESTSTKQKKTSRTTTSSSTKSSKTRRHSNANPLEDDKNIELEAEFGGGLHPTILSGSSEDAEVIRATRDIRAGEELFVDYFAQSKRNRKLKSKTKSMSSVSANDQEVVGLYDDDEDDTELLIATFAFCRHNTTSSSKNNNKKQTDESETASKRQRNPRTTTTSSSKQSSQEMASIVQNCKLFRGRVKPFRTLLERKFPRQLNLIDCLLAEKCS